MSNLSRFRSYAEAKSASRRVEVPMEYFHWRPIVDPDVWKHFTCHLYYSSWGHKNEEIYKYVCDFMKFVGKPYTSASDFKTVFGDDSYSQAYVAAFYLQAEIRKVYSNYNICPEVKVVQHGNLPPEHQEAMEMAKVFADFHGMDVEWQDVKDLVSWLTTIAGIVVPILFTSLPDHSVSTAKQVVAALRPLVAKIKIKPERKVEFQHLGRRLNNTFASLRLLKDKCEFPFQDCTDWPVPEAYYNEFLWSKPPPMVARQLLSVAQRGVEFTNWLNDAVTKHYDLQEQGKPAHIVTYPATTLEEMCDELERIIDEMESTLVPVTRALTMGKIKEAPSEAKAQAMITDMTQVCGSLEKLRAAVAQKTKKRLAPLKLRGQPPKYKAMGWLDDVVVFLENNWDTIMNFVSMLASALDLDVYIPTFPDGDAIARQRYMAKGMASLNASVPKLVRKAKAIGAQVDEDVTPGFYIWPFDGSNIMEEDMKVSDFKKFYDEGYDPIKKLLVGGLDPATLTEQDWNKPVIARLAVQEDGMSAVKKEVDTHTRILGPEAPSGRSVVGLVTIVETINMEILSVKNQLLDFHEKFFTVTNDIQQHVADINRLSQNLSSLTSRVVRLETSGGGGGASVTPEQIASINQKIIAIESSITILQVLPGKLDSVITNSVKTYDFEELKSIVVQLKAKVASYTETDVLSQLEAVQKKVAKLEKRDFDGLQEEVRTMSSTFASLDITTLKAIVNDLQILAKSNLVTSSSVMALEKFIKDLPQIRTLLAKCVQYINNWGKAGKVTEVEEIDPTVLNASRNGYNVSIGQSSQPASDVRVVVRSGSIPNRGLLSDYLGYPVGRGRTWLTWAECWLLTLRQLFFEMWHPFKHPSEDFTGPWDVHRADYLKYKEEQSLALTLGQNDLVGGVEKTVKPHEPLLPIEQHMRLVDDQNASAEVTGRDEENVFIEDILDLVDHQEDVLKGMHPSVAIIDTGRTRHNQIASKGTILWRYALKDIRKGTGPCGKIIENFGTVPGTLEVMVRYNLSPLCGVGLALAYFENGNELTTVSPNEVYSNPHRAWNPACEDAIVFRFPVFSCSRTFNPCLLNKFMGELVLVQLTTWSVPPAADVFFTHTLSYSYSQQMPPEIVHLTKYPSMLPFKQHIGSIEFQANSVSPMRRVEINFAKPNVTSAGFHYTRWQSLLSRYKYFQADVVFELVRCSTPMVSVTLGVALSIGTRQFSAGPEGLQRFPHVELTFAPKESRRFVRFPKHLFGYAMGGDMHSMMQGPGYHKAMNLIFWLLDAPSSKDNLPFILDVAVACLQNLQVYGEFAGQLPYGGRSIMKYVTHFPISHGVSNVHVAPNVNPELVYQNPGIVLKANDDALKSSNGQLAEVWNHILTWNSAFGEPKPRPNVPTSAIHMQIVVDGVRPHIYSSAEDGMFGKIMATPFVRILRGSAWFKGTLKYRVVWSCKDSIKFADWKGVLLVSVHGESVLTPRSFHATSAERAGAIEFAIDVVGPVGGFLYLEDVMENSLSPTQISIDVVNFSQFDYLELYGCFADNCFSSGCGSNTIGQRLMAARNFSFVDK